MKFKISTLLILSLGIFAAPAQTNLPAGDVNSTNTGRAAYVEQVRNACIEGRRYVCGRVVQIVPGGIVVESGYTSLMKPPVHTSWVLPSTISATRDPDAIERHDPDSPCIGLVFVTDIPKRPTVKLYDYVVLHVYPAGQYTYTPVPPVTKTIRRFSAGLDTAVKLTLSASK